MKKLSLSLCLVLILTMFCPLTVFAAENNEEYALTHDELVAMGCAAFPEYADNIVTPRSPIVESRSATDPVVVTKTRTIADGETMTYQEMASGRAFLTFYKSWDETSSSTSGSTKTVTGNLYVNCNISSQVFNITGFKYKINYSGYDSILSAGDRTTFTTCPTVFVSGQINNETSSGSAYHQYEVVFEPNDWSALTSCTCRVTLTVGGDSFNTSAVG